MPSHLGFDVFVSSQIPAVTSDLPPGLAEMKWSPISSTFVSGKRDGVLVDTAITVEQNQRLREWIAACGKNLTTIYATHGHGDHCLVVAGDAAYNDVHLHLGESNAETRKEWIAALDTIESLKPVAVVAGHKRPNATDTPNIIEETRRYIRDFHKIAANSGTALELYKQMLTLYPERVNPAVLWNSSRAIKPGS